MPDRPPTNPPAPFRTPRILGIETSCDDTACAVVDGDGRVLASVVSRQLAAHRPYGGVVPEIASREHLRNWPPVSAEALARAGLALAEVDAVAATRGPGLVGALLVGLSLGKSIAWGLEVPFFAVHHLEGHLYSPFLAPPEPGAGEDGATVGHRSGPAAIPPQRFLGLVVSGGHSSLYAVDGGTVETLGETRDDAMGEVFDKVGKRLGLPYPQGPHVDRLAEETEAADPELAAALHPRPSAGGPVVGPFGIATLPDHAFSFSGLKSQALNAIERLERQGVETDLSHLAAGAPAPPPVGRLLAEFRCAAVAQVLDRVATLHRQRFGGGGEESAGGPAAGGAVDATGRAGDGGGDEHGDGEAPSPPVLAVSGGAAANRRLRRELATWAEAAGVELRLVDLAWSGDNAAMIAHAALVRHRRGEADDPFTAEAESRPALAPRG